MSNNLENLKKTLKLVLNEHMMLNNTLTEMVEKNSNHLALEKIEDEIKELEKDIKFLQEKIRINSAKNRQNEEEKKSFYNEIKKPKLAKLIKFEGAKQKTDMDLNIGDKQVELDDDDSNACAVNMFKYAKDGGNMVSPYDEAMSANRFLVRFEGNIKVPEYYVRKVSFPPSDRKEIYIQIFDFLTDDNRPIITEFNNQNIPFRISIDHLCPTGAVLYTERYHGCSVMEIMRSDLAYSLDEKATMELRITYSDVSYETTH